MFDNRKEFKGAVVGTLLGDSCIPKIQRGINNHFKMFHCKAQKDYIEMKKTMLEYLTGTRMYETDKGFVVDTRVHPFYTKLYSHFYHDGRKTVDDHIMKCLTPLGLALFYFDDGTLRNHSNYATPFICTHNFNKVENEVIARGLAKRFGLEWRIQKDWKKGIGVKEKKLYYWLRLRRKDRDKFFSIISEFAPESLKYKVTPSVDNEDKPLNPRVMLTCRQCGQVFDCKPSEAPRRVNCSMQCYSLSKKNSKSTQAVA